MVLILTPEDLEPFATIERAKAQAMIEDATALALRVAPCIADADFDALGAARAVIRGAILRWHESGAGGLQMQTAGPFSQAFDTRAQRRGMFWPSEIEQLQGLCRAAGSSGAFSLDMGGVTAVYHLPWCSLRMGAAYCSCGADIAGAPIYEAG